MLVRWWAFGTWLLVIISGTAWTTYLDFPWSKTSSGAAQIGGMLLMYAYIVTPFVLVGALLAAGVKALQTQGLLPRIPAGYGLPLSVGLLSLLGLLPGLLLVSTFPSVAVIGGVASGTAALAARSNLSLAERGILLVAGCLAAVVAALFISLR